MSRKMLDVSDGWISSVGCGVTLLCSEITVETICSITDLRFMTIMPEPDAAAIVSRDWNRCRLSCLKGVRLNAPLAIT